MVRKFNNNREFKMVVKKIYRILRCRFIKRRSMKGTETQSWRTFMRRQVKSSKIDRTYVLILLQLKKSEIK